MVAGACGGMHPESVAIIDAGSGRVRTVRNADARMRADVSRAREERASELVTALLADIPGVSVRVHEGEGGAMVAAIELPHSVAITRAEYETEGDVARYVDLERMRIAERLDLFLSAPGAQVCAVSVVVAPHSESERVVSARPEQAYSASNPARLETDEAAARERGTPLALQLGVVNSSSCKPIAGAAVDVLSVEPPPVSNPLLTAKNCVITPHVAWATRDARRRLIDVTAANLAAFADGQPQNVVNA
jgi:hypothetical protein